MERNLLCGGLNTSEQYKAWIDMGPKAVHHWLLSLTALIPRLHSDQPKIESKHTNILQ